MSGHNPKITETDIATLAGAVKAPESLHKRVENMVEEAQSRAPARRRIGWATPTGRFSIAVAGAALAAAIAIVLAVTLPGGGNSSTLTPRAAATLALAPATSPAPSESASNHSELTASVGGVAFPYWKERFGWRGSGARNDTVGGRKVTTIFYSNPSGRRVGYAIVAGPAPASGGGALVRRWGVSYRISSQDGANVIVWRRGGRLCVMAGRGVSPHTLLSLASWGSERTHAA